MQPVESTFGPVENRPSGSRLRNWAKWGAVGLVAGGAPALADVLGLQTRYVLYGSLGLALIGLVPYLAAVAGSLGRLLWILFIFSLQLELSWAPIAWGRPKMAGPYGILISPTLLLSALLVVVWGATSYWSPRPKMVVKHRDFVVASLCFLGAALVSSLRSPDHSLSAYGVFEIVSLILTGIVAVRGCSTHAGVNAMVRMLFVILFIQSAFIFAEQTLGAQFSLAHGFNTEYSWGEGSEGRFAGTFGAPSVAATYLVVCLFFAFGRLFSKQRPANSVWLALLFGVGFCALLLTRTRSEWIAFAIGALGLGWRSYRNGTISHRMCVRLVAAGFLATLIAWPLVQQRLTENHEESAAVRGNLVKIALTMIASHPLTGVGVNNATNQVNSYASAAGVGGWVYIVHNQFLLVGCETGLPGLAAFILVIGLGLRAAYQCMSASEVRVQETGAVLFWSLISMIWALNLDHVSGCKTYFLLWFLVGAACGLRALAMGDELEQGQTAAVV